MASLTKLNIVALLLIFLLSLCGAPCSSASSLHQRERQNSRWFSDCRNGSRKLGFMNCENASGSTNMGRVASSHESLKKALSPPPAPIQRIVSHSGGAPPPPPTK